MKKKAIRFIKDNKGSISLFVIVFVASLLMAALSSLFGADRLARVVLSVSAGTHRGLTTVCPNCLTPPNQNNHF